MRPNTPWQLVRHIWVQQLKQNPVAAILGPVVLLGGVALLLFFSVFLTVGLLAIGAIALLYQALFGGRQGSVPQGGGRYQYERAQSEKQHEKGKNKNNNELEGEYKVIPPDE